VQLPFRILSEAPAYPAVVVDGAFDNAPKPTLHLSHWPGNHTPAQLKHDLSSGSALAFIALPESEQRALLGPAEAWVNSHYDTDGCLALFALREPELARLHGQAILDAAAAGDFFVWPNDQALAIDAIVGGLCHSERSPLAEQLASLGDVERWQLCSEHLMQALPELLRGRLDPYRALWEPVLLRAKQDALLLGGCTSTEIAALNLRVWRGSIAALDPGRHPLFQASGCERVLLLGEAREGTRVRLLESTLTWFELLSRAPSKRPDLQLLAAELNELEPEGEGFAWHAQPPQNPSPELWFGSSKQAAFAEHNAALEGSRIPPQQILERITANLTTQLG